MTLERPSTDNLATFHGPLQVAAGASLLRTSGLVKLYRSGPPFRVVEETLFERRATRIHPVFGRVTCWLMFSAGVEYLAKGVCLVNGISPFVKVNKGKLYEYPLRIEAFISSFTNTIPSGPEDELSFGTLGELYAQGALRSLAKECSLPPSDRATLLAAITFLATSIRNRDSHAYRPKTRRKHHQLLAPLLVPALNILARCLPEGQSLRHCIDIADDLVAQAEES